MDQAIDFPPSIQVWVLHRTHFAPGLRDVLRSFPRSSLSWQRHPRDKPFLWNVSRHPGGYRPSTNDPDPRGDFRQTSGSPPPKSDSSLFGPWALNQTRRQFGCPSQSQHASRCRKQKKRFPPRQSESESCVDPNSPEDGSGSGKPRSDYLPEYWGADPEKASAHWCSAAGHAPAWSSSPGLQSTPMKSRSVPD